MDNFLEFKEDFLINVNYIHEVKIFNEIQNNKKILIFDLRTKEEFKESYLEFSINLPYDELSDDVLVKFDENKISEYATSKELKEMVKRYKRYYIVIIMSQIKIKRKTIIDFVNCSNKEDKQKIIKSLLLYQSLINKKVREIGLYNLGFLKFVEHYYFMVYNHNNKPIAK